MCKKGVCKSLVSQIIYKILIIYNEYKTKTTLSKKNLGGVTWPKKKIFKYSISNIGTIISSFP